MQSSILSHLSLFCKACDNSMFALIFCPKIVNTGCFFVLSLQKERKLTMNNKEYSGNLIFDAYEKDFLDNESIEF